MVKGAKMFDWLSDREGGTDKVPKIERPRPWPDPPKAEVGGKEVVSCQGCGCLAYREKAHRVETFYPLACPLNDKEIKHFCQKCKPPYSRIILSLVGGRYFRDETVEVDVNGKPVQKLDSNDKQ